MKILSIYKPNKKNEGCACSFSLGKDGNVYINAVQQFSWDENKKTGSFAENSKNKEKSIAIKLNNFECGGIIRAIRTFSEFNAFHSYEDNKTSIKFSTWEKSGGIPAFGLSITRNGADKFKLPIETSEAEVIMIFLERCILTDLSKDA